MTKHIEPKPDVSPDLAKTMRKYGFTAVTFVTKPISVLSVGAPVGWFRSTNDAKRFATALNRLYGTDGYKGVSV